MDRQNSRYESSRERGSALILTMGMLFLVMVLFMSFAIIAIYNQENVQVSENIVRARLQAQTGLQRTYAILAAGWANSADANNAFPASKDTYDGFYRADAIASGSAWEGRTYWASSSSENDGLADALATIIGGVDFTPPGSAALFSNLVGWNNITTNTGTDTELLGRIAYLVIDESGKIDPSAVITASSSEGNEARTGNTPTDISLAALFDNSTLADKLEYAATGGLLPANRRWFSYFHIFRNLAENTTLLNTQSNVHELLRDTVFPHSLDYEAFYDGAQDRHRFDLVNFDWDATSDSFAALLVEAPVFWDENGLMTTATGGIPWLYNASDTMVMYQIAANIIDYADSNSIPTADTQDPPRFVGLEKVPYINELLFSVSVLPIAAAGGSEYEVVVSCTPELINMYDTALGLGAKLEVGASLTASTPGGGNISLELTFGDDDSGVPEFILGGNMPVRSYLDLAPDEQRVSIGAADQLTNIELTVRYAKLNDSVNGHLLDYAFYTPTVCPVTTSVASGAIAFMSIEVNDPQHNLPSDQWTWSAEWGALGAGTIGSRNSVCNPAAALPEMDFEPSAVEPWDVSTAFIRNGPMESMWEIGSIHRAAPWQTIRLSAFNPNATAAASGMGSYQQGDANILDQLKMTNETQTHGRVNINTHHRKVVRALLSGVTAGGTYNNPTGGTKLDTIDSGLIHHIAYAGSSPAVPWLVANGAEDTTNTPFRNRGQLAEITAMTMGDGSATYKGLNQNSDAAREEIIGKIVNISTTRPNFFTVIVYAQVIHDNPISGTLGIYDPGIDRILAEQKIIAILRRDAYNHRFTTLRYEYLDE